jgi:hypothetical protein
MKSCPVHDTALGDVHKVECWQDATEVCIATKIQDRQSQLCQLVGDRARESSIAKPQERQACQPHCTFKSAAPRDLGRSGQ